MNPPAQGPHILGALAAWYDGALQLIDNHHGWEDDYSSSSTGGGHGGAQGVGVVGMATQHAGNAFPGNAPTVAAANGPPLKTLCRQTQACLRRLVYLLVAHGVLDDPTSPLDAPALLHGGGGGRNRNGGHEKGEGSVEDAQARGALCVAAVGATQGPGDFRGALLRDCNAEQGLGNRVVLAMHHGVLWCWGCAIVDPSFVVGCMFCVRFVVQKGLIITRDTRPYQPPCLPHPHHSCTSPIT